MKDVIWFIARMSNVEHLKAHTLHAPQAESSQAAPRASSCSVWGDQAAP